MKTSLNSIHPSGRNHSRLGVALVLATFAIGCGSPPISKELRTARDAYASAEKGIAAELAPAELDSARQSLDRAEAAFKKDHKSQETKDLSYVAERTAELADVLGRIEKSKRDRKDYKEKLDKFEKARADMTREELEAVRDKLEAKKTEIERERSMRLEAEGKLAAALTSLKEIGNVKEESRGIVITLSGSVLFTTGKYQLLPIAEDKLNEVAKALKDQGYKQIVVEGHTDARGSSSTNRSLSLKRANSVRSYLISRGIDTAKIQAEGKGEDSPVATNDSAEGRANNRRVELIVTPE